MIKWVGYLNFAAMIISGLGFIWAVMVGDVVTAVFLAAFCLMNRWAWLDGKREQESQR